MYTGIKRFLILATMIYPVVVGITDIVEDDESTADELNDELDGNYTEDGLPVGRTFLLLHLLKKKIHKLHELERVTTTPPFTGCICVPFYLCNANNTIITDGTGIIDVRYRKCTGDLEVCCYLRAPIIPTFPPTFPPTPSTIPTTMPTTMRPAMPSTMPTTMRPAMPSTIPTTMPTTMRPAMPSTIPTTMPTTMRPAMPSTIPTTMPTTMRPAMPSTIPTTMPTTMRPAMPSTIPTTMPTTMRPAMPSTIPTTIPTTMPPTVRPAMPSTIPTTMPTTMPSTIPTTMPTSMRPTMPTTQPTTALTGLPISYPVCICVPVYQCMIYSGINNEGIIGGTGIINPRQQILNTCVGSLVCCSYAPTSVQLPIPTSIPQTFPPFVLPSTPATTASPLAPLPIPQLVLPPIVVGQSCICMLASVCNLGYITISGAGNIDPRLILGRQGQPVGTCSAANSICCQLAQDNVPAVQNSVSTINIRNLGTPDACTCVPTSECAEGNAVTYDGIGAIDPRFGPCASATLVCCRIQNRQRTEVVIGISSIQNPLYVNSPPIITEQQSQTTCGIQDTTYASYSQQKIQTAYFAEFPWMTLLLIRKPGASDVLQCGGSLISDRVVLTAAHCVASCDPGTLFARFGEWDTQSTSEPMPFQEILAQRIVIHPQFNSGSLYHDVAVVTLSKPVKFAVNVRPVCLPAQGQVFAAGTVCYASGWGRSAFGANGKYQTVLRKIDLPIVDNINCQTRLRATRLSQLFQLHSSFICAGGEASKDTCYKDGGGPLVCQDQSNGRFIQAGIISWGIGCGDSTPAVYASVAQHRQWIDQQLLLST